MSGGPSRFRLGLNYWPARTAMSWWPRFDRAEVISDFYRIAASGFDSIRIFLTWEDFQPTASRIDSTMVGRLIDVMDCASAAELDVMPTLFTGHMSGVNWIPPWALGGSGGDRRFRVLSGGQVVEGGLAGWYDDERILRAQETLAGELSRALAGHRALWAWDLGNENSNCVIPPDREHGRAWLQRVTGAVRRGDAKALVTIGLHMEDLEADRMIGPREAAEHCDFLTMHGYPGYAPWTAGATDERLLPFLARLTRWLGGGAEVVFTELGVPTYREGDEHASAAIAGATTALVEENTAADYLVRAVHALRGAGTTGALFWCNADYAEAIWDEPPLDLAVHERSFGVFRADGSPKPAALAVAALARPPTSASPTSASPTSASPTSASPTSASPTSEPARPLVDDAAWLDVDADEYLAAPRTHLPRLFRRYAEVTGAAAVEASWVAAPDASPSAR